jgi:recombination protein RecT
MAGTDLETRSERTLAIIDSGEFAERVEPLLPDTIPVRRFVQLAKTAIRTRPELAGADDRTLFNALIRCAQDGLYPDGREAALNVYRTKVKDGDRETWVQAVQYLPMIGGLRKNLAEYGWTLKTRVVFANDEFSYTEEPQTLRHVPVRPGGDRGDRIAAYAVATHRDGRRLQIVLDAAEIAKRRAKAKTEKVWNEWPDAMWEKSAGHAIFDEIPKSERDRMRVPVDELEPGEATDLLYGPDGQQFSATPVPQPELPAAPSDTADVPPEASGTGGDRQQAAADAPLSAAAPGVDDDPEPQPEPKPDYGATIVPSGAYADMTLRQVAERGEEGEKWLTWAARNKGRFEEDFATALLAFIDEQLKAAA